MADTIIIGAGLAGLSAANYLQQAGHSTLVLEASAAPGGRVKTDNKEGFLLDHGFQVLATAYPEARALLDYAQLDLREFLPGAVLLQADGTQDRLGDPLRDLSSLLPTIRAKVGGLSSKLGILRLRNRLDRKDLDQVFAQAEMPTSTVLREAYGFDELMISRFFQPFYSGIFLEKELSTSRRMFDFVFKMFAEGAVAVPNKGMQQIPLQLASRLPADALRCNCRVSRIAGGKVFLENGESLTAKNIILATEATGIVKDYAPAVNTSYQSTTHVHFVADRAPIAKPIIALDTRPDDLTNSITAMSQVAPGYAPEGQTLLSVSIVGTTEQRDEELAQALREEAKRWFGQAAMDWRLLDVRRVAYALPAQAQVRQEAELRLGEGLYACGDHFLNGSINAAMRSGRLVAQALIKE